MTELLCSSRWPVNSFTDVSFTMAACGEKKGQQGNFWLQWGDWPPCQFGVKAERLCPIQFLLKHLWGPRKWLMHTQKAVREMDHADVPRVTVTIKPMKTPALWTPEKQISPLTHCYQRLKANATIFGVILLHLAMSDLDVLGIFFVFCFVKVSIRVSCLLLPFIICQTCCTAFQFRQNESAISPTVIAKNSFAGSNYLDYLCLWQHLVKGE